MSAIQVRNGKIGDKPIIRAWESFTGWLWLATEKAHKQDSVIKCRIYRNDQIWFGLVIGFAAEWGYFSQSEIERSSPMTWEVKKCDLESISL